MHEISDFNSEQLAENITQVRDCIATTAAKVGRDPTEITLVAVSKTKPLELVEMAYNLGVTDFGENRVQEALSKITQFHPPQLRWHLIGHLQSNKAAKVVGAFACIHSVDSLHLAQYLDRKAAEQHMRVEVLLQVNIAEEASKEGMSPDAAPEIARQIAGLANVEIAGLMTVAPLVDDPEEARPVFRALRVLRDNLRATVTGSDWRHLSMGMTHDYPIAIEEGATIVRVGRAIFGQRPPVIR